MKPSLELGTPIFFRKKERNHSMTSSFPHYPINNGARSAALSVPSLTPLISRTPCTFPWLFVSPQLNWFWLSAPFHIATECGPGFGVMNGLPENEMQGKRNKEMVRSTDTELWSVMEEDDIIVSGQSCSHRSHAALTRSLPDRCTVFACTLVQLSVSLSVSQSTLMSPYLFIYIYVYGYIYIYRIIIYIDTG